MALIIASAGTCVGVSYVLTPLPTEPQDGVTDEGSVVYYADGNTPITRIGANREVVRHEQIPHHVRWAVLAAEDRGFYGQSGVSATAIARAIVANATGGQRQGGSTITQQLARNYYRGLSRDRSARRKYKELIVATKLDRHRSKDEILDLYLNTVYFGRQASGIQAAARAFFHKDVAALTVAEAALLAAMIQQPAYFHTQGDDPPARALRQRWRYVIDGMVAMGKLSRADADRQQFPRTQREWTPVDGTGQTLFIRQRIITELQQLGIGMKEVTSGGLKIYTGLDRTWMEHAAQAIGRARAREWPQTVRVGLIALDPRDGAIKAFHGGDPQRSQVDTVFTATAQAGSTFKPYVLAAALKRGYSVRSVVDGRSPLRFAPDGNLTPLSTPGYLVANDEKIGSLGPVDLITATALSVNTGYVKLAFEAGLDNVHSTARRFGIPASQLAPFKGQAGIALGTPTVSAVQQAAGYASFANGGLAVTPHLITKIIDRHGRSIPLPGTRPGARILSREHAAQATYAMRAVITRGTGRQATLSDREAAGKTGTTDRNRSAWFVGYVPQLSTAVMMTDTRSATLKNLAGHPGVVDGGTLPARIWQDFMANATTALPAEGFPFPRFTGQVMDWSTTLPQSSPNS